MTIRHNLEAVDPNFCSLRRSTLLFGGIVILCLVHFWQNLPIVRALIRSQIATARFMRS